MLYHSAKPCCPVESSLPGPDRVPGKNTLAAFAARTGELDRQRVIEFCLLSPSFLCYLVQQLGHLEINVPCMLLLTD